MGKAGFYRVRPADRICRALQKRAPSAGFALDMTERNGFWMRFHGSKGTTKREGGKIKSVKKSGFPPSLMVFPLHSLSITLPLSRFFLLMIFSLTHYKEPFLCWLLFSIGRAISRLPDANKSTNWVQAQPACRRFSVAY